MNNKVRKLLLPLSLTVGVSGCTSLDMSYTKTGDSSYSALDSSCPVSIYTTHPKKEFDELGIVDLLPWYGFGSMEINLRKANEVKNYIHPQVCQSGGNGILLWEATGAGSYTKVTVIRTK